MRRLDAWLRPRLDRWLARRIPPAPRIRLGQRCIFILPTRFGALFLLMALLIFMVGINYSNSLALGLSFLLLSLFLVAIVETFRNLSGLELVARRSGEGHVGEDIRFELQLAGRAHQGLELGWPGGPTAQAEVRAGKPRALNLFYPARARGWLQPGRLRVASVYPLGLLQAWSWVDLCQQALVFPRPLPAPLPSGGWVSGQGRGAEVSGVDDFAGLKRYQQGDAISQIAWKKQAKGGQLLTKQFSARQETRFWLSWAHTEGDVERRLGMLCHWVLEAERRQQAYGLDIPGTRLEPGLGARQCQQSLRALALFGRRTGDEHPR